MAAVILPGLVISSRVRQRPPPGSAARAGEPLGDEVPVDDVPEGVDVVAESGDQRAVLRMLALRPHYIWLPIGRLPVLSGLIDRDYRVDLETGTSFIATRRDLPRVASRAAPLAGCFP